MCIMWRIDLICSSGNEMKNSPLKLSYVYQCVGCESYHLQSLGRTATTKVLILIELFLFICICCSENGQVQKTVLSLPYIQKFELKNIFSFNLKF